MIITLHQLVVHFGVESCLVSTFPSILYLIGGEVENERMSLWRPC